MFVECATSLIFIVVLSRRWSSRCDDISSDIASPLRLRTLKRGMRRFWWRRDGCRYHRHCGFHSRLSDFFITVEDIETRLNDIYLQLCFGGGGWV